MKNLNMKLIAEKLDLVRENSVPTYYSVYAKYFNTLLKTSSEEKAKKLVADKITWHIKNITAIIKSEKDVGNAWDDKSSIREHESDVKALKDVLKNYKR